MALPVNHWRMAMRVGENGYEMWDECFELGVAAITYSSIAETNFSAMSVSEASTAWADLAPAQKSSLRSLAYEMRGGDVIYVKSGPEIVGKGIIQGQLGERAYAFNIARRRLVDPNDTPWLQQVRVSWTNDFVPIRIEVGNNQRYAIQNLSDDDVQRLEGAADLLLANPAPMPANDEEALLSTESYLRASPARLRIISRRHNNLSNAFADWLRSELSVSPTRERAQIDVHFTLGGKRVLVELKVCFGIGTRHAIREALGQLFEYNYYPARTPKDVWLLVLDNEPEPADMEYITLLRSTLALPLFLGWRSDHAFAFHPQWP